VDYAAVCDTLAAKLSARGARVVTGARVKRLRRQGASWIVETTAGEFEADFLINCAGLQCDRVAQLAASGGTCASCPSAASTISCARSASTWCVLIYPVPDPRFPSSACISRGSSTAASKPGRTPCWHRAGRLPQDRLQRPRPGRRAQYKGLWRFLRRYPSMCW